MSLLESGGTVSNFRPTRRRVQDLELRLGQSKSAILSTTRSSGQAITIVVEDDDDDVRVSSPRSVAQARSSACLRPHRPVHVPVLDDEDLELRLAPAGLGSSTSSSKNSACLSVKNLRGSYFGLSLNATIDLTCASDDSEVQHMMIGKRKHWQPPAEPSKEIKLTCAICMDTMKEETSTVCGHIFCRKCIVAAIQAQKKCPTCRKKLANNQIHRIYLSGSTS